MMGATVSDEQRSGEPQGEVTTGDDRCPGCGKSTVVTGPIAPGPEGSLVHRFVPCGCHGPRPRGLDLPGVLRACLTCGHLWGSLDAAKLRGFIESVGDELARQQLEEFDRGPYRDLPDTALAREVADKVAAMDAMARMSQPAVVRKYRELRGVSWDQAIKETHHWVRLTRVEKLALFGWTPEKKPRVDDLDSPFPSR